MKKSKNNSDLLKTDYPLCKNCKFLSENFNEIGDNIYICTHRYSKQAVYDYVLGNHQYKFDSCEDMRHSECQTNGVLFKAKK